MDPNEALRLWHRALEAGERDDALDHATDLAEWMNRGGFEPDWTEELKGRFWRWWDDSHDATTIYEDPPKNRQEPAENPPSSLVPACEALLAELEEAGIAEAGTGAGTSATKVQDAADDLRAVLLKLSDAQVHGAREALEAAEDWLAEHGAIYTEDCGGENEPGLAGVLAMVRGALGTARATTPLAPPPSDPSEPWAVISEDEDRADLVCGCTLTKDDFGRVAWTQCRKHRRANPKDETVGEYRCPDCGGTDVEGTAWVHLNSDEDSGSEPPSSQLWCPSCDDGEKSDVCIVDRATELCTNHVESAGEKCRPKHKEGEQP